jgi:hypothetical protein
MKLKLLIKELSQALLENRLVDSEQYFRRNFQLLQDQFNTKEPILKGEWKFFKINVPGAITNFKFRHNLTFTPTDIIQTSIIGVGAITFNYDKFDNINLDVTTTGACVVRAFVGRYEEESVQ